MAHQDDAVWVAAESGRIGFDPRNHATHVFRARGPFRGRCQRVGRVDAEHALSSKPDGDIAVCLAASILVAQDTGTTENEDDDRRAAARRRPVNVENLARVFSVGLVAQDRYTVFWCGP